MKKLLLVSVMVVFVLSFSGLSLATNGDNLMSVGPVSRAMGGVGIAAPQDALGAVFANPAAMCFGPYCPGSEVNIDATVFMPKARTKITMSPLAPIPPFFPGFPGIDTGWKKSDSDLYLIPALAISTPITDKLRFGFAGYGVSGLGVDYRDKFDLNPQAANNQDIYTDLSIMKIAPNIAYLITPNLSIGASIHVDMGVLDLDYKDGTSTGWAIGGQVGAIYKNGPVSLGLVYVTPQKVNHKGVADFDGNGKADDLSLESPQSVGFGIAVEPVQKTLLIEADAKWLNWSDAVGYRDFDWRDQWVFSIGTQYKPTPKLALRAGFNYGRNPVKTHSWNDTEGTIDVQGKHVPRTQYEFLRITGFPAIVEKHITAGIGYEITKSVSLNIGYTHGFENHIKEKGTIDLGGITTRGSVESTLSENSVDLGLTYRF
jgi:long-chain fatty acid transport protein